MSEERSSPHSLSLTGESQDTPLVNVRKALEVIYDLATSQDSTNEFENSLSAGSQSQVQNLAGDQDKRRKGKEKALVTYSLPLFLLDGQPLDRGVSGVDMSQGLGGIELEDIRPLEGPELLEWWEECLKVSTEIVKKGLSTGSQNPSVSDGFSFRFVECTLTFDQREECYKFGKHHCSFKVNLQRILLCLPQNLSSRVTLLTLSVISSSFRITDLSICLLTIHVHLLLPFLRIPSSSSLRCLVPFQH